MNGGSVSTEAPTREQLLHRLVEAAEIEHTLMCTYLYAAFSLKRADDPEFSEEEGAAVARWRKTIVRVAIEEMGHLTAVWNITVALGGPPPLGRGNFPLDPGGLPAGLVVKLVPFGEPALQHFVHVERPHSSSEPDGQGFSSGLSYRRSVRPASLVPMELDYETVGEFYELLGQEIRAFSAARGEAAAFCGDVALQLSADETALRGVAPVRCAKTAAATLATIVEQGEGAPFHSTDSHFVRFSAVRDELAALVAKNPGFLPAFPAATNPVLRPPPVSNGRVWLEDPVAAKTVDLANSAYALMLRLLGYAYVLPRGRAERSLVVDLSRGIMHVVSMLGERAASLPAGPSSPGCNAGMSFTALRGPVALTHAESAGRVLAERFAELANAAAGLELGSEDATNKMRRALAGLRERCERGFAIARADSPKLSAREPNGALPASTELDTAPPAPSKSEGIDEVEGKKLTVIYEDVKCIHSRVCVTWGPRAFLPNVSGPWIVPDAMDVDAVVEIAHACPSGAIRYRRKDGKPDESAPPVNLLSVREAGPYAIRADLSVAGRSVGFRATLCRCGASKHKPFCDGSHREIGFSASGEPPTGAAAMLAVRDGPLSVEPTPDGPLEVRGNLEITSGTGRVVARLTQARLCRCGGSSNKPFCDDTHERIGFRS